MKHLNHSKTALLLTATLFAATGVFAQQPLLAYNNAPKTAEMAGGAETPSTLQLNVLPSNDKSLTFHINVDNPRLEKVRLLITDVTGYVLHEETLPVKAHFETRYNLEMLEDGAYKIVLSTRQQDIERSINIRTSVNRTVSMR
ncbi:hypothetical protein GA0116948_10268 [Chitinophaga costaii]|uniref:Por secretion system C-terminal sorting domain-containing protein n=1 Tax=Chitinophaga costaii TaxID=1335309 RepID=A0A1C4AC98_9BACT|nr:hypothetical protein [Chitinophaga costaii]PUZ26549.1 hypothetical protein DCM91_09035 [Chitinophaga costaii]SCB92229.1 hypothetical protein GA0116948_10268 [Chitinophaga costaii]